METIALIWFFSPFALLFVLWYVLNAYRHERAMKEHYEEMYNDLKDSQNLLFSDSVKK